MINCGSTLAKNFSTGSERCFGGLIIFAVSFARQILVPMSCAYPRSDRCLRRGVGAFNETVFYLRCFFFFFLCESTGLCRLQQEARLHQSRIVDAGMSSIDACVCAVV